MEQHDLWADIYDAMNTLTEDIPFYMDEAVESGGPVLELGVGTGRVAIPIAQAGVNVVGLDHSPRMLEVAKRKAKTAGLSQRRLRLVQGDMRDFDVGQRFPLAIIPFRAFLHMYTVEDQKRCLQAHRPSSGGRREAGPELLHAQPADTGGRFVGPGLPARVHPSSDRAPGDILAQS